MVMEIQQNEIQSLYELPVSPDVHKTYEELAREELEIENELVGRLVYIAKEPDIDIRFEQAKNELNRGLNMLMEVYIKKHPSENLNETQVEQQRNKYKTGMLSETCAIITLEQLGFTLIESTLAEDQTYGIDLYAIPPAEYKENEIWAIQIKNVQNIDLPVVEDLKDPNAKANTNLVLENEQYDNVRQSQNRMLGYLSDRKNNPYTQHEEFIDNYVRPVMLFIPGRQGERGSGSYKRNGEPVETFPPQLEQAFEKAFHKN